MKIILFGPKQSGKTRLRATVCEHGWRREYEETLHVEFSVVGLTEIGLQSHAALRNVQLWDTPSCLQAADNPQSFYHDADAFVLLAPHQSDEHGDQPLKIWLKHYLDATALEKTSKQPKLHIILSCHETAAKQQTQIKSMIAEMGEDVHPISFHILQQPTGANTPCYEQQAKAIIADVVKAALANVPSNKMALPTARPPLSARAVTWHRSQNDDQPQNACHDLSCARRPDMSSVTGILFPMTTEASKAAIATYQETVGHHLSLRQYHYLYEKLTTDYSDSCYADIKIDKQQALHTALAHGNIIDLYHAANRHTGFGVLTATGANDGLFALDGIAELSHASGRNSLNVIKSLLQDIEIHNPSLHLNDRQQSYLMRKLLPIADQLHEKPQSASFIAFDCEGQKKMKAAAVGNALIWLSSSQPLLREEGAKQLQAAIAMQTSRLHWRKTEGEVLFDGWFEKLSSNMVRAVRV